ncbi:MAG: hypothetical protein ACXACO_09690 [Promethearchaeota archaeon]|jgi:hypothetical protein
MEEVNMSPAYTRRNYKVERFDEWDDLWDDEENVPYDEDDDYDMWDDDDEE